MNIFRELLAKEPLSNRSYQIFTVTSNGQNMRKILRKSNDFLY